MPITQFASASSSSSSAAASATAPQPASMPSTATHYQPQAASSKSKTQAGQGQLSSYISTTDVLKAEIIWALKCIDSHYSMNSCAGIENIFRAMFHDSSIARGFGCADKKTAYLCTFGLGPYFAGLLNKMVKSASTYVLLFDETLNKELQEKQMDVHFRFWDRDTVVTQYFESMFLGHGTAEHLFTTLSPLVTSLGHSCLLQLSMDGPNVNQNFGG